MIRLCILFLLFATSAFAQPAGHDDPRFREALTAWLADDDQTALPALAELAKDDSRAAQIFLGIFAHGASGPWVDSLTEPERRALLRAPGGSFGRSWLLVAAEAGNPLAQSIIAMLDQNADEDTVRQLASIGEPLAAAKLALLIQARTGEYPEETVADLWRQGLFPGAYALSFAAPILQDDNRAEILRLQGEASFPSNAMLADIIAQNASGATWSDVFNTWVEEVASRPDQSSFLAQGYYKAPTAPHMLAPRIACDQACGASTDEAMICFGAFSRYMFFVFPYLSVTTSSELLVPQAQYASSKRAARQLARQVESSSALQQLLKPGQAVAGHCVSDLVGDE